jgi:hypothetical protein
LINPRVICSAHLRFKTLSSRNCEEKERQKPAELVRADDLPDVATDERHCKRQRADAERDKREPHQDAVCEQQRVRFAARAKEPVQIDKRRGRLGEQEERQKRTADAAGDHGERRRAAGKVVRDGAGGAQMRRRTHEHSIEAQIGSQ